ncbi:MAG: membrane protein insertion efficiency factor YidD [Anaerolineaceae bacterium]|nr:membrane protein insertion efficiency factor YidD [Anaerolineaceae bacterium]
MQSKDHPEADIREIYHSEPRLRDLKVTLKTLPRWVLLSLFRAYQAVISPALPPDTCRYYPSCSHYGYQAVYRFGVIKGTVLAVWRVLRCNPFSAGGYDPVPEADDRHHFTKTMSANERI